MPTVLRVGGFSFRFYSREHSPAHVHCYHADGIVVEIATAKSRGKEGNIRDRDIRRAEALVAQYRDLLQGAWDEYAKKRGEGDGQG
jgi:Domain of unknown function (DUF4160)